MHTHIELSKRKKKTEWKGESTELECKADMSELPLGASVFSKVQLLQREIDKQRV